MAGVSDTGFITKTLPEILDEIKQRANSPEYFGENFPTTPDSTFHVHTGVVSGSISDIWSLAQAVADQQNRDSASGIYLDYLARIIGLVRLAEVGSSGSLLFTGTQGTNIPQFFPVSDDGGRIILTDNTQDLNRSLSYQSTFIVNTVSDLTAYNINIQGNSYNYVSDGTATETEILDGLKLLIDASLFVDALVVGSTLVVTNKTALNTITTTNTSNLTLSGVGVLVDGTSTEKGDLTFVADSITTLVGTNPGLISVTNPSDFTNGRITETDEELRDRMDLSTESAGTATKPSIEASLSQVAGVTDVLVVENTDIEVDVNGIPGKAYETFVTGGTDGDIAQVLWDSKPAAILTHGDIPRNVVDINGDTQTVNFSRKEVDYAWMRVTYSSNPEEVAPADVEQALKDAVVAFGNSLDGGEDYEPTKFYAPLYTVPSVYITLIEIDVTDLAGDTPTYGTARIAVEDTETLEFDVSRVVITT